MELCPKLKWHTLGIRRSVRGCIHQPHSQGVSSSCALEREEDTKKRDPEAQIQELVQTHLNASTSTTIELLSSSCISWCAWTLMLALFLLVGLYCLFMKTRPLKADFTMVANNLSNHQQSLRLSFHNDHMEPGQTNV